MYINIDTHVNKKKQKALEIGTLFSFLHVNSEKRIPLVRAFLKKWLKYPHAYISLDQFEKVTGYERRQIIRLLDYLVSVQFIKRHKRGFSTTVYIPNLELFTKDNLHELSRLIPEAYTALMRIYFTSNQPIKSGNVTQYKSNIRISYNLPAITWTPAIPRSSSSFFLEEKIREREGPRHEMGSSAHEPSMFELQQWEIDHFDAMSASSWKELVN